jgi:hypothetical protein
LQNLAELDERVAFGFYGSLGFNALAAGIGVSG